MLFTVLLPACVAIMLAGGQVLFKRAGLAIAGRGAADAVIVLATMPAFWASLVLYGLATLLWIVVLSRAPLSRVYPFVALPIVLVPLLARAIFEEPLGPFYLAGLGLVVCGVILTQLA